MAETLPMREMGEGGSAGPARSGRPKRRLVAAWLVLLGVWLACLPPLVVKLGRADTVRTMENVAVMSTQDTWLRQHGSEVSGVEADRSAWLIPTYNMRPRLNKPPLTIWMNLLAMRDLRPGEASAGQVILRCRLVAVGMCLMLIGAVYWAGWTLGGLRLAVVSALVVGTMWFVQRQGRIASYDIHMAAWATLSIAAGLWAIDPLGRGASRLRRWIGWGVMGVALGCAALSKGPLAFVITLLPLGCVIATGSGDRGRQLVWLLGGALLACAVIAPWYGYVYTHEAGAARAWVHEAAATTHKAYQTPLYYLGVFAMVLPWTMWLIGALCVPMMAQGGSLRPAWLGPWLWFVLILVVFSIPAAKQQRYILPILPAAGLLIGLLWAWNQSLADRGEMDEGINRLRVPHWIGLGVASLVLGPLMAMMPQLQGPLSWWWAGLGTLALVALTVLGSRWHWQWRPMRAALATAAWALVATTMLWSAYADSSERQHPIEPIAGEVNAFLGGRPLAVWHQAGDPTVNEEFLIYTQRLIPREVPGRAPSGAERFVMTPEDPKRVAAMMELGWHRRGEFSVDKGVQAVLWSNRSEGSSLHAVLSDQKRSEHLKGIHSHVGRSWVGRG